MKRLSLKHSLSIVAVVGTLCANAPLISGLTMPAKLQAVLGKKNTDNLSATEQGFINDYAQKVSSLMKDLFTLFDDYTNPSKGGSHTEYTDKAKALVADYKKLMDTLKQQMDGCSNKNGNFYKLLTKAYAIAQARYATLEQVCQVMESYKGTDSNYQLALALKPLKNKLSSAEANAQLRNELIELQAMMVAASVSNASQLQTIIEELVKPVTDSNPFAQLRILEKRLSNG